MTIAQRLSVLDPTVQPATDRCGGAARLDSLDGKVIGLYNNGKPNAARLVELVGEELGRRYALQGVVRGVYSASHGMRREEWAGIEQCDAIVLATGD
ncbi:MAG TPA: hypothetical protein VFD32_02380 [Dehalococcoidia bacterium]|nr:hypothetical protein [Dehalococcoidia bacterium]